MAIEHLANQDFDRAFRKAFWRKITSLLIGENNKLLPFDEVRERLPIKGQHYLGHQEVPIDKIIGSVGRYGDFDRAFLPIQTRTKERWLSIDQAHYNHIHLPSIELIKMGDIYFVKDGNHRVSVARERGQEFIDAYVTEIDIPVPLTLDTQVDNLFLKQEYAYFVEQTSLPTLRPNAHLEGAMAGTCEKLLEHIAVHRWYLGEQRSLEVSYPEAVASWYDNIYLPIVSLLKEQDLLKDFRGATEADLYIWIMSYIGYLKEAYRDESVYEVEARKKVGRRLAESYPLPPVRQLMSALSRFSGLEELILSQEWAAFNRQTGLPGLRPESHIKATRPGMYERLLEHIAVHRWYLGEQLAREVPYPEAVISWYDRVYTPIVQLICAQNILEGFPGRTEADLYLWIIESQAALKEVYGDEISIEEAAEQINDHFNSSGRKRKKPRKE